MNIDGLITEAKARFNHNSAKAYLKEKYTAKLLVANQGGLWKVTPELITFLNGCGFDELVLLDSYENPIKVKKAELLPLLVDTYLDVMNEWHEEYEKLRKKR